MSVDSREKLQQFFKIPVETLGLSEPTLRALKWEGITSVGACIWFYVHSVHRLNEFSPRLRLLMHAGVEQKMKEQGHWSHLLDTDFWDFVLWQPNWEPHSMMVMWHGEEQDLCQIPIERLGLSEAVTQAVEIFKVKTIGQWFQEYGYHYPRDHVYGDDSFIPDDLYFMMLGELLLKMKEQDCWSFIAESLYPE